MARQESRSKASINSPKDSLTYILGIVGISSVLILSPACADKDKEPSPPSVVAKPPEKPLPGNCSNNQTMTLDFQWQSLSPVFEYHLEFGFAGQSPFDSSSGGADLVGYFFDNGKRGRSYTFTLRRQLSRGSVDSKTMTIKIPLCEEREKYQQANPEYNEPIVIRVGY